MKILTSQEVKLCEQAIFERIGVPSYAVMEIAGREVVRTLLELYFEQIRKDGVLVLTGGGNNGGDGYVVARTLHLLGYNVSVLSFKSISELKGDALISAKAFLNCSDNYNEVDVNELENLANLSLLSTYGVVVDAIYGTGFKGNMSCAYTEALNKITDICDVFEIPIVSIDVPSGLSTDSSCVEEGAMIANVTVAIGALKPCHVLFPASSYCGDIYLADIGISDEMKENREVERELLTEEKVSNYLKFELANIPDIHKGDKGHVAIIGGSRGLYGAPLSAKSALKCSAGLVSVLRPFCNSPIFSLNELMYYDFGSDEQGGFAGSNISEILSLIQDKDSLVIGPGMGRGEGAWKILEAVLDSAEKNSISVVIDADALNLIAEKKDFKKLYKNNLVLTPHPGEMARLLSKTTKQIQENRIESAIELAKKFSSWVVLKGARTVISSPSGQIWINPTVCDTLATTGSGDVLAGVISALLARGLMCESAVCAGVFIHGSCGELARIKSQGKVGVTASDLIELCPIVMNKLFEIKSTGYKRINKILPQSVDWLG